MSKIYDQQLLGEVIDLRNEVIGKSSMLYKYKDKLDQELSIMYVPKLYNYIQSVLDLEGVFKTDNQYNVYVDYHLLISAIDHMGKCESQLHKFDNITSYMLDINQSKMLEHLPTFRSSAIYNLFRDNARHCYNNLGQNHNIAYLHGLYLDVGNSESIKPSHKIVYSYEQLLEDSKSMNEKDVLFKIESRIKAILSVD